MDPERGWVATANNRPAPDDYPYPLSGCWSNGMRAERVEEMLEAKSALRAEDFVRMQYDTFSLRARRCLPALLHELQHHRDKGFAEALHILRSWACRMEADQVGATLFEVFFAQWMRKVIEERFVGSEVALLADSAPGLAAALLQDDRAGWFAPDRRPAAICDTFASTMEWLAERLGSDMVQWTWGRLHVLPLRHFLSGRGDLANLLDRGGVGVGGDFITVCNTGTGPAFEARSGAGYRLIADLATAPAALGAMDGQSQSGHPGSPHYADQLPDWLAGDYHYITLQSSKQASQPEHSMLLQPM
jgi:penicillin amidase